MLFQLYFVLSNSAQSQNLRINKDIRGKVLLLVESIRLLSNF